MVRRAIDAGSELLLLSGVPSPEDPRPEVTRAYFLMAAVVLNKRTDMDARKALGVWRAAVAAVGCPYCAAVHRAADECRRFPEPGVCPLVS